MPGERRSKLPKLMFPLCVSRSATSTSPYRAETSLARLARSIAHFEWSEKEEAESGTQRGISNRCNRQRTLAKVLRNVRVLEPRHLGEIPRRGSGVRLPLGFDGRGTDDN